MLVAATYKKVISVRLIALIIFYTQIQFPAFAGEAINPKTISPLDPIAVHNLHLTKTAQIGLLRFDIIDNADVGTKSFMAGCKKPYTLSFGAWEALSENKASGIVRGGFNLESLRRIFATEFEKYGYPAYVPDLSLFETRVGSDADFRIAVTVTNVQFAQCSTSRNSQLVNGRSYVQAKWEVFSQRDQTVVYTKTVEASYETPDVKFIEEREFNRFLLRQLTDNLLSDHDFVAIFR
jgi:hypothetical protein